MRFRTLRVKWACLLNNLWKIVNLGMLRVASVTHHPVVDYFSIRAHVFCIQSDVCPSPPLGAGWLFVPRCSGWSKRWRRFGGGPLPTRCWPWPAWRRRGRSTAVLCSGWRTSPRSWIPTPINSWRSSARSTLSLFSTRLKYRHPRHCLGCFYGNLKNGGDILAAKSFFFFFFFFYSAFHDFNKRIECQRVYKI